MEIGPGDNLEVAAICLARGAREMVVVEKYSKIQERHEGIKVFRQDAEKIDLSAPVDFAYSNDVLEHVSDVRAAMRSVYAALTPGGKFTNSIDLRGHNCFSRPHEPLDFLTCPDWLWRLMFSNIVTTNRVRASEFVEAARAAGFKSLTAEATAVADPGYLRSVKPRMLPRYRNLPDADLATVQMRLVLQR
jgi:SAM-dependent methyltransferase